MNCWTRHRSRSCSRTEFHAHACGLAAIQGPNLLRSPRLFVAGARGDQRLRGNNRVASASFGPLIDPNQYHPGSKARGLRSSFDFHMRTGLSGMGAGDADNTVSAAKARLALPVARGAIGSGHDACLPARHWALQRFCPMPSPKDQNQDSSIENQESENQVGWHQFARAPVPCQY